MFMLVGLYVNELEVPIEGNGTTLIDHRRSDKTYWTRTWMEKSGTMTLSSITKYSHRAPCSEIRPGRVSGGVD